MNRSASFCQLPTTEVGQINKAVNHVEPGESTLIQKIRDLGSMMENHVETTTQRFDHVNDRIDALTEGAIQLTSRFDEHLGRTGEVPAINTGP